MTSHKLFSDSLNGLNSSMSSAENPVASPPSTPVQRRERSSVNEINYKEVQTDSESDSMEEKDFFTNAQEKQPYTFDEDVEILKFVLKDQNIFRVSSILLWKYLEAKKKNPKRTYQSLKNRFLRNIKPKLFSTYSHLIQNQDQVKKILMKFPELKKNEATAREPLKGLNPPPRKEKEKRVEKQPPAANGSSPAIVTSVANNTSTSTCDIIPATVNPIEGEICSKKVKLVNNCVVVKLYRKLGTSVPYVYDELGIYEKYLKFKAKNKLIPCPTCGRCGGLEGDEVQESETDDDVIGNSAESRKPVSFINIGGSPAKASAAGDNVATSPAKDAAVVVGNNVTPRAGANAGISAVKKVAGSDAKNVTPGGSANRQRKRKSPETLLSPSLLGSSKSSDTSLTKTSGKKPRSSKSTAASSESKKYQTAEEEPSVSARTQPTLSTSEKTSPLQGGLTDKELESLYQETVQERQKLMDSEEEEELVKKCLKKSRRMIGFDSYVLLNKINLDSFFAKSISPPLDTSESITPAESKEEGSSSKSGKSPLVQNMLNMSKSRNKKS